MKNQFSHLQFKCENLAEKFLSPEQAWKLLALNLTNVFEELWIDRWFEGISLHRKSLHLPLSQSLHFSVSFACAFGNARNRNLFAEIHGKRTFSIVQYILYQFHRLIVYRYSSMAFLSWGFSFFWTWIECPPFTKLYTNLSWTLLTLFPNNSSYLPFSFFSYSGFSFFL